MLTKKCQMTTHTTGAKNFAEIALSRNISEINVCFFFQFYEDFQDGH